MSKGIDKLRKVLSQVLDEDSEFPPRRLLILLHIYEKGPVTGVDIEEALGLLKANIWGHLGKLSVKHNGVKGKGFVTIVDSPGDWRSKQIEITPEGRKFVNKLIEDL